MSDAGSVADVRVVTWNVRGSAKPDLDDLAAAIRSLEPDVVAIQEIRAGQAHVLAHKLGFHVRWARKHFPYGVMLWWRAEGLAVLSPHHLDERHTYLLTPSVHSWTYRRRIALRVRVHTPAGPLWVFNAHLSSHDENPERVDQAVILAGAIATVRQAEEVAGEPFTAVVAGDLNAHDEPEVLLPLGAARFVDAWPVAVRRIGDPGFTSTSAQPQRRIDYVLVGEDDHVCEAHVPATDAAWQRRSDHLPVVVQAQIRSK